MWKITLGDYNNDGNTDWYTTGGHIRNILYRNNGDGTVTDVAEAAGVDPIGPDVLTENTTFFDYVNFQ